MASLSFSSAVGPAELSVNGLIPYIDILNSLGSFIYIVNRMRVVASSMNQLIQPITYVYKDANGDETRKVYSMQVEQELRQPVIDKDVDMVFDGKTHLDFTVLAGQTANLYFEGKAYEIADYIKAGGNISLLKQMVEGQEL